MLAAGGAAPRRLLDRTGVLGKGLATRALQELTGEVTQRPLHAWVATSNVASIRVLEKCGFVRVGSQENDVEELLFELRDGL